MKHFKSLIDFHRFNQLSSPLNSLFSVVSCKEICGLGDREFTTDFYMIGLKRFTAGNIMYGRTKYDHDNGSMMFVKPRQIMEFKNLEIEESAFLIFIHEDFLYNSALHSEIGRYGFFDYETNEALHLSPMEEQIMWDLFFKMQKEYQGSVDEFSRDIILSHIDSVLKYSQRFYKRQFVSRFKLSGKTVTKFNSLLDEYFQNGIKQAHGLPTVKFMASKLNVSVRYLSDLLKQETGKTAIELIHIYLINEAKNRLMSRHVNVSEIAYELGFENLPYFSRLFKKETGQSPNQFRKNLPS